MEIRCQSKKGIAYSSNDTLCMLRLCQIEDINKFELNTKMSRGNALEEITINLLSMTRYSYFSNFQVPIFSSFRQENKI